MINISRRLLANYAVDQLASGQPASKLAKRLAATLLVNKAGDETELLIADIAGIFEDRGKLAQATVTSATPLTDKLRREVKAMVKAKAGVNEVSLIEVIDPACLGGLKVETSSKSWDKTIARKLADIKGGI